jgi:hypothetical protein
LARCTNSSCCQSHPVEMFIKTTMPLIGETRILSCFLGRLKRYLVVCNFGCLIQSLDCLHLLSAIQCLCLECASYPCYSYPGQLKLTIEHKAAVHRSGKPSPFSPAYQPPHFPYCRSDLAPKTISPCWY